MGGLRSCHKQLSREMEAENAHPAMCEQDRSSRRDGDGDPLLLLQPGRRAVGTTPAPSSGSINP